MDILDVELKPEADWVADSKRRSCVVCDRKFSTFVRKHHCRMCGEVICKKCSSHRRVRVSPSSAAAAPPSSRQRAQTAPASSHAASPPTSSANASRVVRLCINCISPVLVDSGTAMLRLRPPPLLLSHSASLAQSSQSTNADYDELNRVDVLQSYFILDTLPTPEFNAICSTAAKTFGCAVAAISFLDATRQWYKARMGIQPPHVPRDVALCSHLLERPFFTPLVVLDTRADNRFRHNPLVTGAANVRFYAAMPIVNADGFVLGSIFVLDCKPRLDPVETRLTDMLLHLAKIVMDMLEEHRARELSRLTVIEEATNEHESGGSSHVSTAPRRENDDGIPLLNSGSTARTVRESSDQDMGLPLSGGSGDGLATPPGSAPTMEPWSMTSSSKRAAAKAKAIEVDTTNCRDKFLHCGTASATGSGVGRKSEAETACLDLLCRVTDTQQMLAQQQTFIFERLSLHSARMDRLEACMRALEGAFHDLAVRLPPPSQASQPPSAESEFITI